MILFDGDIEVILGKNGPSFSFRKFPRDEVEAEKPQLEKKKSINV